MTTKTKSTGGILTPLLSYRFRVLFGYDIDTCDTPTIDNLILTQQIVKTDLDLLNKKLYIEIRQSITLDVFMAIADMMHDPNFKQTIVIEPMGVDALWSIHFTDCKCIHYKSSFDYAKSDVFCHKLTFEFHRAITSEPVDWKLYGTRSKFVKLKGTLTPAEAITKYEKSKTKPKTKSK